MFINKETLNRLNRRYIRCHCEVNSGHTNKHLGNNSHRNRIQTCTSACAMFKTKCKSYTTHAMLILLIKFLSDRVDVLCVSRSWDKHAQYVTHCALKVMRKSIWLSIVQLIYDCQSMIYLFV